MQFTLINPEKAELTVIYFRIIEPRGGNIHFSIQCINQRNISIPGCIVYILKFRIHVHVNENLLAHFIGLLHRDITDNIIFESKKRIHHYEELRISISNVQVTNKGIS